jgi:hypothetical protein
MIPRLRFNMYLNIVANSLIGILGNKRMSSVMKLLVRVLSRWYLHHTGDDQRRPMPVPNRPNQIAIHLPDELQRCIGSA